MDRHCANAQAVVEMLLGHDAVSRVLYPGLAVMMVISIWDLFSPAQRVCTTDTRNAGTGNVRNG